MANDDITRRKLRFCTRDHMTIMLRNFGGAGCSLSILVIISCIVNKMSLGDTIITVMILLAAFLWSGLVWVVATIHNDLNPRHWLLLEDGFEVALHKNAGDLFRDFSISERDEVQDKASKWCRRNCRGRWKFNGYYAYFSRRTDATMFTLFQESLDEI